MPDFAQLMVFLAAGLVLNLTPGPDVMFIVAHAVRAGARAGVAAALGIAAGCLVHVAAAALGVSALLAASSTAFSLLKWAGALYLVWVGAQMLRAALRPDASIKIAADADPASAKAEFKAELPLAVVLRRGFLTNVLNPKVALFFLAFVPQFIAPATQNKALAFVLLGVLFNVNAIPVNALWALAASWMARRVGAVQKGMHWLDRVAGAMFIGFGLKLAFTEQPSA